MKKIFAVLLIFICAAVAVGCGEKTPEIVGGDMVDKLRSEAAEYSSARYYVTDVESNAVEQVFSFYYDTDGKEVYLNETFKNNVYTAEYNDGTDMWQMQGDSSAKIDKSNDGFKVYTKKKPDPYALGSLFFYAPKYISSSEQSTDGEGNILYLFIYDIDAVNKELGTDMTEFSTSYAFDKDGRFVYFRQHNASPYDQNNVASYTYEITVDEINAVTTIDNPCKAAK